MNDISTIGGIDTQEFWDHIIEDDYEEAISVASHYDTPVREYLLGIAYDADTHHNKYYDPKKSFECLKKAYAAGSAESAGLLAEKYLQHLDDDSVQKALDCLRGTDEAVRVEHIVTSHFWPELRTIVRQLANQQDKIIQSYGSRSAFFKAYGIDYCENTQHRTIFNMHSTSGSAKELYNIILLCINPRKDWQSHQGMKRIYSVLCHEGNPNKTERASTIAAWLQQYYFFLENNDYPFNKHLIETYDIGPTYNRFNIFGIPILGDVLPSGANPLAHLSTQGIEANAYVPDPGIVGLGAIEGYPDGTVKFKAISMNDRPALLLEEDFNVLMALVFTDQATPAFDLKSIKNDNDEFIGYAIKTWNPPWIAQTALGKTLYVTDRLLGDLGMSHPCVLERVREDFAGDARTPSIADAFISAINEAKAKPSAPGARGRGFNIHQYGDSDSEVVSLRADGVIHVGILEGNPRIAGWAIRPGDDEKYDINENEYVHGAIANTMTLRYDELALMLPVYERYRQLLATYYGLLALKETGFKLNRKIKVQLDRVVDYYSALFERRNSRKIVHFKPWVS